jgi:hypothetical protein
VRLLNHPLPRSVLHLSHLLRWIALARLVPRSLCRRHLMYPLRTTAMPPARIPRQCRPPK